MIKLRNIMIYNIIIIELKKFCKLLVICFIPIVLLLPFAGNLYIERQIYKLFNNLPKVVTGIEVAQHVQRGYWRSVLITKIRVPSEFFIKDPHFQLKSLDQFTKQDLVKIPQTTAGSKSYYLLTLQHKINFLPSTQALVKISSKLIHGLPDFISLPQDLNLVTVLNFNGIKMISNNFDLNYSFKGNKLLDNLSAKQLSIELSKELHNLIIKIQVPKLQYQELEDLVELENLDLKLIIANIDFPKFRKLKLLTAIERLYVLENNKPIVRLANLTLEHKWSNNLITNLNFLKLNIFEQKFGPLALKANLTNIGLNKIGNYLKNIFLSKELTKFYNYKFMELVNQLVTYHPNLTLDLLLQVDSEYLQVLSDFMLTSNNADLFTPQEVLAALAANINAKMPKAVLFELLFKLEEIKQQRAEQLLEVYKYDPKNKHAANMLRAYVNKNSPDLKQQLAKKVIEKIEYLSKNNIIKAEGGQFKLDLAIASGSFYSKMNPFKIFSF